MTFDRFLYRGTQRFFAQVSDGAEGEATAELLELGARNAEPGYRGIYFSADNEALYRVVYLARIPTHVLVPLVTFDCHSSKYLYRRANEVPWESLFRVEETFAVSANVANSAVRHSQYAAQRVKDAIVDRFRDASGARPSVDRRTPGVWINLYMNENVATLSLDVTGGAAHRRGYRIESVEAPMQEHVAATIIRMTGWDGASPLVDPMCGSGTLLSEALMHYCRIPAGRNRSGFGFTRLPDFDEAAWKRVRDAADASVRDLPAGLISGSDASTAAVRVAKGNLATLPGGGAVPVVARRFEDIPAIENATIVTNPPYGIRIGRDDPAAFVKSFGDFLKQRCRGCVAFVFFGDRELIKHVGLRTSFKKPLHTGGLDGRLVRYDLY